MTTIYHNPRCTKSRLTLQLLQDKGIEPEVVKYLEDAPSVETLAELVKMLDMTPWQLLRRNEDIFKELTLTEGDDAAILAAMHEHPKLIERPIVVRNGKAKIGRPPENILELL